MIRNAGLLVTLCRIPSIRLAATLLWLGATFCGASCVAPAALATKLHPLPTAEGYTQLGDWFASHQQFECAADDYENALKLRPASARLGYLYGQSLLSSGKPVAAVHPLQQAVRLDPKAPEAHLALAAALDQTQHTREAELEWKAALDLNSQSAAALNGLAADLLAEKDAVRIIALLGATPSKLDPGLAVILAKAYSDSGRLEDASKILRASSQADPSSARLANALAGVQVMQSRKQEAEDVLEATLNLHPADIGVELLYLRLLVMERRHRQGAAPGDQPACGGFGQLGGPVSERRPGPARWRIHRRPRSS